MLLDDAGTKKFVVARIHAPVEGEEFDDVCFMGLGFSTGFKFCLIDIFGGVGFYEMEFMPAYGDGGVWMIHEIKLRNEGRLDFVVAVDKANIIAGSFG